MANKRVYSRKAFPHRILFDTTNPQRGDDVKVLQRHTRRRLEARDIDRPIGIDGVYGPKTREAAKTASHFLGCPDDWHQSKSGLLVREQRVIIYPETRTTSMLEAARARMDKLLKDREDSGSDGLTANDRSEARRIAVAAFKLAYQHAGNVHYTQSAARWQGIHERRRYADRNYPTQADCSSMYTWCLWNALTSVAGMGYPDVVNGSDWLAGYTGTLLAHGERVTNRMPGDAVLYGTGFPGSHVAMVAEDTSMVYSHGSEGGPYYVAWNYRSDVLQVRRYIR